MNRPVELDSSLTKNDIPFVDSAKGLFSDNRNVLIAVLCILLLLSFSRIDLIQNMAMILFNIVTILYNILADLVYMLTYSIGEILNASSNTVTTISKTSLDLGNGAINNVGNLLTDVNCQYRGNPVKPNQCKLEDDEIIETTEPSSIPPTIKPTLKNTPTRRINKTTTPKVKGKHMPTKNYAKLTPPPMPTLSTTTPIPTINTTTPIVTYIPTTTMSISTSTPTIKVSTQPTLVTPLPTIYAAGYPNKKDKLFNVFNNNEDDIEIRHPIIDLDNVLEGMENRKATEFDPEPASTLGVNTPKTAWCLAGKMNEKKTCIEINPSKQGCMSGMLYSNENTCKGSV